MWCKLNFVQLAHAHFDNLEGVYIIWHGPPNPATVYVGRGMIRERLEAHRKDERIQKPYAEMGLFATWAAVPAQSRGGVEAFLKNCLKPEVNEQGSTDAPIPVNLPW